MRLQREEVLRRLLPLDEREGRWQHATRFPLKQNFRNTRAIAEVDDLLALGGDRGATQRVIDDLAETYVADGADQALFPIGFSQAQCLK